MQKLMGLVRRCVDDYDMIKPGDRIAVGVSGGKEAPRSGVTSDLRFGNGGRNFVFYPFKQPLTGDVNWTRFEFELTTPPDVGKVFTPYIGFYLHKKCTGTAWIDHVELIEVKK